MLLKVYPDIANAFDTINDIFLFKLGKFAFDQNFIQFFAYLSNRTQSVSVVAEVLIEIGIIGGPHGSVFALFMFSVYMKDLRTLLENSSFISLPTTKKIYQALMIYISVQKDSDRAIKWSKNN